MSTLQEQLRRERAQHRFNMSVKEQELALVLRELAEAREQQRSTTGSEAEWPPLPGKNESENRAGRDPRIEAVSPRSESCPPQARVKAETNIRQHAGQDCAGKCDGPIG